MQEKSSNNKEHRLPSSKLHLCKCIVLIIICIGWNIHIFSMKKLCDSLIFRFIIVLLSFSQSSSFSFTRFPPFSVVLFRSLFFHMNLLGITVSLSILFQHLNPFLSFPFHSTFPRYHLKTFFVLPLFTIFPSHFSFAFQYTSRFSLSRSKTKIHSFYLTLQPCCLRSYRFSPPNRLIFNSVHIKREKKVRHKIKNLN